jgi:hypothetical protein
MKINTRLLTSALVIQIRYVSIVSYQANNLVENPNADFYQSFGLMTSTATRSEGPPPNPIEPKRQNLFGGIIGSAPFEGIDDEHSYLINTLYFTDSLTGEKNEDTPFTDAMKRNLWLQESYSEIFKQKSTGPKFYLLKLIEFNKIAILEKSVTIRDDWWCTSSDPT